MRKFTLIEIIVTIVALSIILAIIMINFFDIKKKTVTSTMSQNISIMQGMVDTYYIKNNNYPILNEKALTLENPQLIDVETLVKSSVQKKDLDLSKIEEQYYWVDVFGKVWGSTKNAVQTVNLIEKENNLYNFEALISKEYKGYNIYEVNGYLLGSNKNNLLSADTSKGGKYYKLISENEIDVSEEVLINYEFEGKGSQHLYSFIDEYGLESAPMGKSYNPNTFKPLIKMEGEYDFEIEGLDMMYWIDFITLEEKPGKSTIDYLFAVKDENGDYGQWTTDFFSLEPSKGIRVKVNMKGDDEGNKPSLYDLHILFKYEDEDVPVISVNPPKVKEEDIDRCPPIGRNSDFGRYTSNLQSGRVGNIVYSFYVSNLETLETTYVPQVTFGSNIKYNLLDTKYFVSMDGNSYIPYTNQDTSEKCMFVDYEVEVLSVKEDLEDKSSLCGNGSKNTRYLGDTLEVVYSVYLEKGQFINKIDKPAVRPNWILTGIQIQMSHKGAEFETISSVSEIKDESCIEIIFKYKGALGYPPVPNPPISYCFDADCVPQHCGSDCLPVCTNCTVVEEPSWCDLNSTAPACQPYCLRVGNDCVPPVCTDDCSPYPPDKPEANDKELNDPEWETVDRLKFFGHGAVGQLTRWYKAEHTDSIISEVSSEEISLGDDVRIVYRYARSSGSYWGREYSDFTTTGHAQRVMAVAYIQVRAKEIDNVPVEDYPYVVSMKFHNEKGVLDVSMVQPSVVIIAEKDNNIGREVFSDESIITWDYVAADPRNRKITEVEWGGDKRDKYPVGTYEVKVRVRNEVAYWSEWTTFKFDVVPEKPIAVINSNPDKIYKGEEVKWYFSNSSDPDEDKLTKVEWAGDKQSTYTKAGEYTIRLRVQDAEGHWSDWAEKTFKIIDKGTPIYRIEAETTDTTFLTLSKNYTAYWTPLKDPKYSEGGALSVVGTASDTYVRTNVTIEGSGFSIKGYNGGRFLVQTTGFSQEIKEIGEFDFGFYELEEGKHSVVIYSYSRENILDYIEVYSSEKDQPLLKKITSNTIQGGLESDSPSNLVLPKIGQSVIVHYNIFRDSKTSIVVLDSNNKKIRTLKTNVYEKGGSVNAHSVIWDGKDDSGKTVARGQYKVRITKQGVLNLQKTESDFLVNIDAEESIYRIEAETTDTTFVRYDKNYTGTWYNIQDSKYSEGQAVAMVGSASDTYARATFAIYGSGFDLKFKDPQHVRVYVDGVLNAEIKKDGDYYHTVRNLEEKQHSVVVYSHTRNTVLDYLDVYSNVDKPEVQSVKSYSYQNGAVGTTETNVVVPKLGQNLIVYNKHFKDSTSTITVHDSKGVKVRDLETNKLQKGGSVNTHAVIWDGKNNSKESVITGIYELRYVLKGVHGTETKHSYNIDVRNEEPIYRVEAETTNTAFVTLQKTYTAFWNTQYDAAYSEGAILNLSGSASDTRATANVVIEGTGFDVRLINPSDVRISVAGTNSALITAKGEYFYSVRNLPAGKYTVSIASHKPNSFVDYVDVYNESNDLPAISKVSVRPSQNNQEMLITSNLVVPNLDSAISYKYKLVKNAYVTARIYDSSNNLVRTLKSNVLEKGGTVNEHSVVWNGKDDKGKIVNNGSYTLRIEGLGIHKKQTATIEEIIKVDNGSANSRLEGEINDSKILTTSNTYTANAKIIEGSSYSGGGAMQLNGYANDTRITANYKITGTGVDIKIINPNGLTISMGGKNYGSITQTGEFTFSIRDLPQGTHTLTLVANRANNILDYIDIH